MRRANQAACLFGLLARKKKTLVNGHETEPTSLRTGHTSRRKPTTKRRTNPRTKTPARRAKPALGGQPTTIGHPDNQKDRTRSQPTQPEQRNHRRRHHGPRWGGGSPPPTAGLSPTAKEPRHFGAEHKPKHHRTEPAFPREDETRGTTTTTKRRQQQNKHPQTNTRTTTQPQPRRSSLLQGGTPLSRGLQRSVP